MKPRLYKNIDPSYFYIEYEPPELDKFNIFKDLHESQLHLFNALKNNEVTKIDYSTYSNLLKSEFDINLYKFVEALFGQISKLTVNWDTETYKMAFEHIKYFEDGADIIEYFPWLKFGVGPDFIKNYPEFRKRISQETFEKFHLETKREKWFLFADDYNQDDYNHDFCDIFWDKRNGRLLAKYFLHEAVGVIVKYEDYQDKCKDIWHIAKETNFPIHLMAVTLKKETTQFRKWIKETFI
jgi:hypothetical protein